MGNQNGALLRQIESLTLRQFSQQRAARRPKGLIPPRVTKEDRFLSIFQVGKLYSTIEACGSLQHPQGRQNKAAECHSLYVLCRGLIVFPLYQLFVKALVMGAHNGLKLTICNVITTCGNKQKAEHCHAKTKWYPRFNYAQDKVCEHQSKGCICEYSIRHLNKILRVRQQPAYQLLHYVDPFVLGRGGDVRRVGRPAAHQYDRLSIWWSFSTGSQNSGVRA